MSVVGTPAARQPWLYLSRALAPRRKRMARFVAGIPSEKPAVLMVSHALGGGTEQHVRDLAACIRDEITSVLLLSNKDGSASLSILEPPGDLTLDFDPSTELMEFVSHLRDCHIERVHIHHNLGCEGYLKRIVIELGKPFDFTIHDYFVLAPQPHLTGDDDRFVGEALEAAEQQLLGRSISRVAATSLMEWQEQQGWLVQEADRVIAPSRDAARRIRARFPRAPVILAPHLDRPAAHRVFTPPPLWPEEPLHIALLGILAPHKGYRLVLEAARSARLNRLPLKFTLIGFSGDDKALLREGVEVTGRYVDADLPASLMASGAQVVWYAAQCPETYSYTFTVGLVSDCCLVVPDLGAFPERAQGRPWTWIAPWNGAPGDWNALFLSIQERLLAARSEPAQPSLRREAPVAEFYRVDYLSWTRSQVSDRPE
jgi:glycosyltransferase involved in cell wall biosynthesis